MPLLLCGCSLLRKNPLEQNRGAILLVFDTRTAGDLKTLRRTLNAAGACATVFASGQITRGMALSLHDVRDDGNEIGMAGYGGVDPLGYSRTYGHQKYFQDEILVQVLDAKRHGLNPRYCLLGTLMYAKSADLTLPSFLISKGFARVVHKMPAFLLPKAKPREELTSSMVHAYAMTTDNFDRAQIAALAKNNEILIVMPSRQVLSDLLDEAHAQGVPFATIADLGREPDENERKRENEK